MRKKKHSNIDTNLYADTVSCGIGGEKRNAIAILFHALMEAMAAVRNTSSLSLELVTRCGKIFICNT